MRILLLAAGLACLTACNNGGDASPDVVERETASPTTYERIEFDGETATEAEQARCKDAGGTVAPAGRRGAEHCIQQFPDAGQSCMGGSDCTGDCLVTGEMVEAGTKVTGQCASDDNPFGCRQTVADGKAKEGICVD